MEMERILVNSKDAPKAGNTVTYADVNLWSYRGVIVAVGPQAEGGDCLVQWRNHNGSTGECLSNLRRVVSGPVERQRFAERLSKAATELLEGQQN
jgi:hypothetical protein